MRITVSSRVGHFNLLNPEDESVSCVIRVYEGDEIIKSCSFSPESPIETSDFDLETIAEDLASMIEEYQKRLWLSTSREKDLEFAKWLRDNGKKVSEGNITHELKQLKKKRDDIDKQIKSLEACI